MADIKDISGAIQTVLEEVGVHGRLDVEGEGKTIEKTVGTQTGDDVVVKVVVEPANDQA